MYGKKSYAMIVESNEFKLDSIFSKFSKTAFQAVVKRTLCLFIHKNILSREKGTFFLRENRKEEAHGKGTNETITGGVWI